MSSNKGYDNVIPGSLKLKGGIVKKKKKSKKSSKTKEIRDYSDNKEEEFQTSMNIKTDAEVRFEKAQKLRLQKKVESMSSKSHKDKVQEFNDKLEKLSEHYDIPKVGPG